MIINQLNAEKSLNNQIKNSNRKSNNFQTNRKSKKNENPGPEGDSQPGRPGPGPPPDPFFCFFENCLICYFFFILFVNCFFCILLIYTVSYSKDCLPKGLPTRPTRSVPTAVPYRPVFNIFQKNRECDFFEKLRVGKTDRPPTADRRRTDPYSFRTVPKY